MSRFSYRALRPSGDLEDGHVDADGQPAAVALLRTRGLTPVSVELASGPALTATKLTPLPPGRRARLLRQLGTLLRAGLPADRALALLSEGLSAKTERALALRLMQRVRDGARLSEAAATEPAAFDAVSLAILRAGELSGQLGPLVLRVAEGLERVQAMRDAVRSALIYPVLVLLVAMISIGVLVVGVLPRFAQMFTAMGRPLPAATALLLDAGAAAPWVLVTALAAWLAWRIAARRRPSRPATLQALWLRLPVLGELLRQLAAERMARVLGTLLEGGVPMVDALRVSAGTVGLVRLEAGLLSAADRLRDGARLSAALAADATDLPPLVGEFVRVGEETGTLAALLLEAATLLEGEARTTVQRLSAVLAPALTVLLGILVGTVILTLLSALMDGYDLAL
jgi:general secretion pathway protein F